MHTNEISWPCTVLGKARDQEAVPALLLLAQKTSPSSVAIALALKIELEHSLLGQHDQVIAGKDEIGNAALDDDLANKITRCSPDVEPIPASTVDIPVKVGFEAIGNACMAQRIGGRTL